MSDFTFPTTRQRGLASYEAEVIKVYEGFNANYGPKGKDGLYIKIKMEKSGAIRDIFYPMPPSAKADKLLTALTNDLGMDIDAIGWAGLEGYTFRWAAEDSEREIFDKDTGQRRKTTVRLEFPVEVISEPNAASSSNGVEAPEATIMTEEADYEAFRDEVLALADGKSLRDLRLAAAQTKSIRGYPKEFRAKLNNGDVLEELISQGRLEELPSASGDPVYQVV